VFCDREARLFFFDKKNLKTFAFQIRVGGISATAKKSFLVLFFKKEHSCLLFGATYLPDIQVGQSYPLRGGCQRNSSATAGRAAFKL
jgi:hypothetical protein